MKNLCNFNIFSPHIEPIMHIHGIDFWGCKLYDNSTHKKPEICSICTTMYETRRVQTTD